MGAYASTGELVTAEERVRRCVELRDAGVRAVKLRLHSRTGASTWRSIEAVREAVGSDLELMVDANQGWRMPGDLTPRWTRDTAVAFARELERLDVYWLEEPLPTADVEGTRRSAERRTSASPRERWCARWPKRATSSCAGRRRRAARRRPERGDRGLSHRRGARRGQPPHVEPAHVVERLRAAREPARRARALDLPFPRGPVRPARVVRRSGETGSSR